MLHLARSAPGYRYLKRESADPLDTWPPRILGFALRLVTGVPIGWRQPQPSTLSRENGGTFRFMLPVGLRIHVSFKHWNMTSPVPPAPGTIS
jgi:hypothetical protein